MNKTSKVTELYFRNFFSIMWALGNMLHNYLLSVITVYSSV